MLEKWNEYISTLNALDNAFTNAYKEQKDQSELTHRASDIVDPNNEDTDDEPQELFLISKPVVGEHFDDQGLKSPFGVMEDGEIIEDDGFWSMMDEA